MPSMKWCVVACVGIALSPSCGAGPAPQTSAAQAEKVAAPAATGAVAVYTSKHGFSVEYPKGWVLHAFIEDETAVGKGIANPSVFQLYNYDPDHVANPGDPVPPDKIKIEVLVATRSFKTYDEWLLTLPRVQSAKDFATAAGVGRDVVNTETSMEDGRTVVSRRVILLTPVFEIDFRYYPIDAQARANFDRIVASFRVAR